MQMKVGIKINETALQYFDHFNKPLKKGVSSSAIIAWSSTLGCPVHPLPGLGLKK